MSKIMFYVPYREMEKQVHTAWSISETHELENELYPNQEFEYDVATYTQTDSSSRVYTDADVIVARGATAISLKGQYLHTDTHVVEIPVTATDLVSVIRRALKHYGNLPMAITGTYNMTYGSSGVIRSNRYAIQIYHSRTVDETSYEEMVRRAQADGCKIIIGGVHTTDYARSIGLFGERLSSSVESLLQAISAAKAASVIAAKERRRLALYQAIIKNTYSGVLSYTQNNEIVTMNDSARLLLGIKEERQSENSLGELIAPGQFLQLLTGGDSFKDKITRYKDNTLVLSKTPIPLGDGESGSLATFQNAAAFVQYLNDYYEHSGGFSLSHTAEKSFGDLICSSAQLQSCVERAKRFAQAGGNILITGETGVGKSAFAQAIHNFRPAGGLFLSVECSGLTIERLMGANGKPGIFELANGGTLYLRELGALSAELQSAFWEVCTGMCVLHTDSGKAVPLDMRIISSSERDLAALVRAGNFNARLYYALSTLTLEIPPLRDRPEDIMPSLMHCLTRKMGSAPRFRHGAMELLLNYKWYGNMCEVENCCDRLCALNREGPYTAGDILENLVLESPPELSGEELELRLEKRKILETLAECNFKRSACAAALGMSRTTLWRKLRDYGILS